MREPSAGPRQDNWRGLCPAGGGRWGGGAVGGREEEERERKEIGRKEERRKIETRKKNSSRGLLICWLPHIAAPNARPPDGREWDGIKQSEK